MFFVVCLVWFRIFVLVFFAVLGGFFVCFGFFRWGLLEYQNMAICFLIKNVCYAWRYKARAAFSSSYPLHCLCLGFHKLNGKFQENDKKSA